MTYKKSVFRSLTMVTQLGLSVITPIFLCIFAGYQIDTRFGTKWMIPLLILGTLAGGRSAWIMVKKVLEAEVREDERLAEQARQERSSAGTSNPKQPSRIRGVGPVKDKEKEHDGLDQ